MAKSKIKLLLLGCLLTTVYFVPACLALADCGLPIIPVNSEISPSVGFNTSDGSSITISCNDNPLKITTSQVCRSGVWTVEGDASRPLICGYKLNVAFDNPEIENNGRAKFTLKQEMTEPFIFQIVYTKESESTSAKKGLPEKKDKPIAKMDDERACDTYFADYDTVRGYQFICSGNAKTIQVTDLQADESITGQTVYEVLKMPDGCGVPQTPPRYALNDADEGKKLLTCSESVSKFPHSVELSCDKDTFRWKANASTFCIDTNDCQFIHETKEKLYPWDESSWPAEIPGMPIPLQDGSDEILHRITGQMDVVKNGTKITYRCPYEDEPKPYKPINGLEEDGIADMQLCKDGTWSTKPICKEILEEKLVIEEAVSYHKVRIALYTLIGILSVTGLSSFGVLVSRWRSSYIEKKKRKKASPWGEQYDDADNRASYEGGYENYDDEGYYYVDDNGERKPRPGSYLDMTGTNKKGEDGDGGRVGNDYYNAPTTEMASGKEHEKRPLPQVPSPPENSYV